MNPCCQITKNQPYGPLGGVSSTEFVLSEFDEVSKAFISSGQIHQKVIALYLSLPNFFLR